VSFICCPLDTELRPVSGSSLPSQTGLSESGTFEAGTMVVALGKRYQFARRPVGSRSFHFISLLLLVMAAVRFSLMVGNGRGRGGSGRMRCSLPSLLSRKRPMARSLPPFHTTDIGPRPSPQAALVPPTEATCPCSLRRPTGSRGLFRRACPPEAFLTPIAFDGFASGNCGSRRASGGWRASLAWRPRSPVNGGWKRRGLFFLGRRNRQTSPLASVPCLNVKLRMVEGEWMRS
jgi:hypothetical protein